MKTITINKESFQITAGMERAILQVAAAGPQAVSDFSEGRSWRHSVNHVASAARKLPAMTGGALQIAYAGSGKVPARSAKQRPRVVRWVVPADARRFNLVVRKLTEQGAQS